MKSILSNDQKRILGIISQEKQICDNFYLTGGTALAEFYLQHRLSEDLDFFSEAEFEPQSISIFLKKIQKEAGIKQISYNQSFNRNIYIMELQNGAVKTEFTYFPFPRIEIKKKIQDMYVDSLIDIAVNKIFTIYQKPRSRDFIDLYCILEKEQTWSIDDLAKQAQIKFDHYINPLELSAQFVKAEELKDYPKMLIPIEEQAWQKLFLNKAKELADREIV